MRVYDLNGTAAPWPRISAYDGQALIAEYNTSGSILRRYVHGPGVDEPVVWYEGSGTSDRRFLHADERGSVIALTNSSGTSIGTNAYDEYGIPASTNLGRFSYTGQTWLPEIGMHYYKARIYSPTLGRFMQTDPIGYGDGMNLYAYVANDPVNQTDFSGKCPACIGGIAGGLLELAVQVGVEGRSLDQIDGTRVLISVAAGATGAGLAANAGRVGTVAIGAVVSATQSAANDVAAGEDISATKALTSGALGAVGGAAGRSITNAAQGSARTVARSTGQMVSNRAGQTATPTATTFREGAIRAGADATGMLGGGAIANATPENVIVVTGQRPGVMERVDNAIRDCFGMCDGIKD